MPHLFLGLALMTAIQLSEARPEGTPPVSSPEKTTPSHPDLKMPGLPESTQAALAQQPESKASLLASLQALDQQLAIFYAKPELSTNLGSSIKVPPERTDEAKFLSALLQDSTYERLEDSVFQGWDRWQKNLQEAGLRAFRPQPAPTKTGLATESNQAMSMDRVQQGAKEKALGQHLSNTQAQNSQPQDDPRPGATDRFGSKTSTPGLEKSSAGEGDAAQIMRNLLTLRHFTLPSGRTLEVTTPELASALKTEGAWKEKYGDLLALTRRVSDQEVPGLAKTWRPMAEHLEACATKLSGYEASAPKEEVPALHTLRVQAKVALLERYRCNLWLVGMVRSYLTFQPILEVPPKFKPAAPAAQVPQEAASSASALAAPPAAAASSVLAADPSASGKQEPRPWPGIDTFLKIHVYAKSDEDLKLQMKSLYEESPRFRKVVEALWAEQPKVVFILRRLAKLDPSHRTEHEEVRCFGSLIVQPVGVGFAVTLLTQTELASRGLDMQEPWLAQLLFAFLEVSRTGSVVESGRRLMMDTEVQRHMWNFQLNLRGELKAANPGKYQAMPYDGENLFLTKLL